MNQHMRTKVTIRRRPRKPGLFTMPPSPGRYLEEVLDLVESNLFTDFTNHDCFTREKSENIRSNLKTDKPF